MQKRKELEVIKASMAEKYKQQQSQHGFGNKAPSHQGDDDDGVVENSTNRALVDPRGRRVAQRASLLIDAAASVESAAPLSGASTSLILQPPRRKTRGGGGANKAAQQNTVEEERPSKSAQARKMVAEYVPPHQREELTPPRGRRSDLGMIYISRGFNTAAKTDPRTPTEADKRHFPPSSSSPVRLIPSSASPMSSEGGGSGGSFFSSSASGMIDAANPKSKQHLRVKRKCAVALLNMSTNEVMLAQFAEEGGLAALLDLALSTSDPDVVLNCAACLVNLIPYGDFYAPRRLLEAGVVRVIVRLASSSADAKVRYFCALCLCRLAAEPDLEEWLILEGALAAATRFISQPDSPMETREVAAKILINLAVTMDGHQVESLVKNVLKAVAILLSSTHHTTKQQHTSLLLTASATQQFCAEALASLSCLPVARPILAKQGVVAVLKALLLGSMSPETTNACGAALCNMGTIHGCRKEMLSLGLIRVMSRLLRMGTAPTPVRAHHHGASSEVNETTTLDDDDGGDGGANKAVLDSEVTQKLCTLCLTTLSFQKDLRHALLKEGALRTIAAVVRKRHSPELTRQGAYALLNFAFDPMTREDVIAEDALPALMILLENDEASRKVVDAATRANALMAMCNLLADPATVDPVLEAGALDKLVGSVAFAREEPDLHEIIAVAFLNLSTHADARRRVIHAPGCAELLLDLCQKRNPPIHSKAVRALFNYAMDADTHEVILKLDLLPALAKLVHRRDNKKRAAGSRKKKKKKTTTTTATTQGDDGAAAAAAAAASASSSSKTKKKPPPFPEKKVEPLSSSSSSKKRPGSKESVASASSALGNAAGGERRRAKEASEAASEEKSSVGDDDEEDEDEVPPLVESLEALEVERLAEERRVENARMVALFVHSLTTSEANHKRLFEQGAMTLLVALAERHDEPTRTAVAGSMYNLTQVEPVTTEPFLDAVMALSRSTENERVLWCAWCLANVSTFPKGRAALGRVCTRLVPCLLAMTRSGCADAARIQYQCAIAMCNTLSVFLSKQAVEDMLADGTIQDIIVITVLRANDVKTRRVLSQVLFNLIAREDTRLAMIQQDVPLALIRLTKNEDAKLNALCGSVMHNLSYDAANLVPKVLELKVARIMVDQTLSPSGGGLKLKKLVSNALVNFGFVPDLLREALTREDTRIVAGLQAIAVAGDPATLQNVALVAFQLSTIPEGRAALIKQQATAVLTRIVTGEALHRTSSTVSSSSSTLVGGGGGGKAIGGVVQSTDESKRSAVPVVARQLVVAALRNLSTEPAAHEPICGCAGALEMCIDTMAQAKVPRSTRLDAAHVLCNLICHRAEVRAAVARLDVLTALQQLARATASSDDDSGGAHVIAKMLRNLTSEREAVLLMAEQGAMSLCARLAKRESVFIKHDVATAICNLCSSVTYPPAAYVEDGVISALFWLALQDVLGMTKPILRECAVAIRCIVQSPALRPHACADANLMPLLVRLAKFEECDVTRYDAVVSIYFALMNEISHKSLVRQGVVKLLVDVAAASKEKKPIFEVCSAALHQLPSSLLTNIDGEMLSVLLGLLKIADADFTDPAAYVPDRSFEATSEWPLRPTSEAQTAAIYDAFRAASQLEGAEWPTTVVGKSMPAFLPARFAMDPVGGEQVNPSRAKGTTEMIGEYRKMTCAAPSQLTAATLKLSLEAWLSGVDSTTTDPLDRLLEKKKQQQRGKGGKNDDDSPESSSAHLSLKDRLEQIARDEATEEARKRDEADREKAAQVRESIEARERASEKQRLLPSLDDSTEAADSNSKNPAVAKRVQRASDLLAKKSIAAAFASPKPNKHRAKSANNRRLDPLLLRQHRPDDGGHPSTAPSPTSKHFNISRKRAQQERVADDYFELLYNLA